MMGLVVYDAAEHVKNNCTLCKHFCSYENDYFDPMEPQDMGFCKHPWPISKDDLADATMTCEKFEEFK